MRLTRIHARNFIGLADVDLPLSSPVCVVAGSNAAGKSSLREALALALTGDLARVRLKKEAGSLVRGGAKKAEILVADSDGDERRVTITAAGAVTDNRPKGSAVDPMLPYVLDAQRFAGLTPEARRDFLFGLMAVQLDRDAVKTKLAERGHAARRIDRIAPLLRQGFPAAHAEAKTHASNARALWRNVTGETYGATKAETWEAEAVANVSDAEIEAAVDAVEAIRKSIGEQQKAIGALESDERNRAAAQAKLTALQAAIDLLPRRREKLARDEQHLKESEEALRAAEAKAGTGPRVGLEHDLAKALAWSQTFVPEGLHDNPEHRDGVAALEAYERQHGKVDATDGDPAARRELPNLSDAVDLMVRAVQNASRDLRVSEDAEAQAKVLREQLAAPFDADALKRCRDDIAMLDESIAAARVTEQRLRSLREAARTAVRRTQDAAEHHADALAWDALADALSPNGIPAELLAQALGPINARLAQSAADTTWHAVTIDADMGVTYGGRPYALCSESERWRADAMLAEAVTHLSGCGLLVLDRGDVLDPASRGDLFAWLGVLAENVEIGTAVVLMTLKEPPPAGLLPKFDVHWLVAGKLADLREKEAA